MTVGVLMLNFGEPEHPTLEEVTPFLERIFLSNTPLERFPSREAWASRCRDLAESRAPGLMADYQRMGGSPLNRLARAEQAAMQQVLGERGHDARTCLGYQFMEPSIHDAVEQARGDGAQAIVALPMYPLCGFSTNVAAIRGVREAAAELEWDVPVHALTAWHNDHAYRQYRAANIATFVRDRGLELNDPDTLLYFSAHGTPIKYLDMGSRYDGYVEEHCADIAELLGGVSYTLGYQNHSNRGIAWTQPDNADHLPATSATKLIVEPISFLHEQSETLSELDVDFAEDAAALGKEVHRVPVPSDHARLASLLADLIEPLLSGSDPAEAGLSACRCSPGSVCTNGDREISCHYSRASA